MKEIIDKATEIGLLIRQTEIYKNYADSEEKLKNDHESEKLLDRYENLARNIQQRKLIGEIIEHFEYESLKELSEEIKMCPVIMTYLQAQSEYVQLLETIQKEIQGQDGESR